MSIELLILAVVIVAIYSVVVFSLGAAWGARNHYKILLRAVNDCGLDEVQARRELRDLESKNSGG